MNKRISNELYHWACRAIIVLVLVAQQILNHTRSTCINIKQHQTMLLLTFINTLHITDLITLLAQCTMYTVLCTLYIVQ